MSSTRGSILIITLIILGMLTTMFLALSGIVNLEYQQGTLQSQDETAFQLADSGLDFGRWRLAHAPTNFTTVTQSVTDQFSGPIGTYQLTFTPPLGGSTVVTITSVGATVANPQHKVTVVARYGIPSLAKYSFITNSDVWYDETISGPVHSNGGIRMDGTSDSAMTSAKATYTCQTSQGCNPPVTKPGVWGSGQDSSLWQFPAASIDYESISTDLQQMKQAATTAGTYWGPSGKFGYHIVFNADGTYTISKVTSLQPNILSWGVDNGWVSTSQDIKTETVLATAAVPEGGILYTEDNLWIDGTVTKHVSVAAGVFPDTPATNVDIIINGNITYAGVHDGTREFGATAQRNVVIPYSAAPDVLTLEGAFIAQKGYFGRRYYNTGTNILRTSLTYYGMVASNTTPVTTYVDTNNTIVGGYRVNKDIYDPNLIYQPPPYFPTSGQYQFISWQEP